MKGPSGGGKTDALLNLIQKDKNKLIDKIYLSSKDLEEPKYHLLIKKCENGGIKNLNDPNAFIEYLKTMMFTIMLMITTQKEKEKF